jgi:subtilisin family serine protease
VSSNSPRSQSLPNGVEAPYDWALEQLRIPQAHEVTRGHKDVVVAVIDIGYTFHPDHEGHLWTNPNPNHGDVHGWDFAEDDASLEYDGSNPRDYSRDHQAFVVGEVAAVAPDCPIMILRDGYEPHHRASWGRAVRYAVDHGARVLALPHGYITQDPESGIPLFHKGTDFSYPGDNVEFLEALDYAYEKGALVIRGAADNRGRRVAVPFNALESVVSVGSTNRHRAAAPTIAASTDYVEVAAPGGESPTDDPSEKIWGTGGNGAYVPFAGGCMACGFGAAVAGLVVSRYPELSNQEIRQILRNTADGVGWDTYLGHGILDPHRALTLSPEALRKAVTILPDESQIRRESGRAVVEVAIRNSGVFDVDRVLVVVYNGDPTTAADPTATMKNPKILLRKQLGHSIVSAPGLEQVRAEVEIDLQDGHQELFAQASALDLGAAGVFDTTDLVARKIG